MTVHSNSDSEPTANSNDRVQLSAWLDGELDGEQGRFFAKRVAHDTALQQQAQRWSLAGELLREGAARDQALQAPHSFLDRVRVAIDNERLLDERDQQSVPAAMRSMTAPAGVVVVEPTDARHGVLSWLQRPTTIAASLTLMAGAVLLMRMGLPIGSDVTTSLTMQQVTLPSVKANNEQIKRNNRIRAARYAVVNRAPPRRVPAVGVPAASAAVGATTAAGVPAAPAVASARLPDPIPRRSASVNTSGTALTASVRPNVVVSKSDPFGVGANLDSRILSGKPWPRATLTGDPTGTMKASFSPPESAGSAWPSQMSMGVSGVN